MPGNSFDIISSIRQNVIGFIKKRQSICTAPCDGLILQMHYKWTFWFLLAFYFAMWYNWHTSDITCVSHFNADAEVRLDHLNICYSYPYVLEDGKRRYILYYRWLPYALLVLAGLYYIPRKLSKMFENSKTKKFFEDLAIQSEAPERQVVERAVVYAVNHWKTHNELYFNYLICNIIALLIDCLTFYSFNFLLQEKFMSYGWNTLPFRRDVLNFSDYMSKTFPPFVHCEIAPQQKLINKRTEQFGCHLRNMELYEKIFFALWFWLIILASMTVLHIIFLLSMKVPFIRYWLLKIWKPRRACHSLKNIIDNLIYHCKIGDFYLLYRLREHFSHASYYDLILKLSNQDFTKALLNGISIESCDSDDSLKSRHRLQGNFRKQVPNSSILVE